MSDLVASTDLRPDAKTERRSATGETAANRRGQLSWALFEFARSPYLSLVYIYVFPPYFANTIIGDPIRGQEAWSLAFTIVGVCVAVLAPVLGAIADRTGGRKPWLLAIVAVMAPCCIALWWAMPAGQGGLPVNVILMLIVVLGAFFQFSDVFHSSMLPSIAPADRVGGLSGIGIAVGNAGTMLALVVMLFGVALPASDLVRLAIIPERPLFGLDPTTHEHNRIAGPVAGVWFIIFVTPLFLWTPDRKPTGIAAGKAIREGLSQLWETIKRVRQLANVGLYLIARMLYTDGKVVIIAYAGIYASGVFGWDLGTLLVFGVLLSPFAIAGGLLGGWVDNRFGSKRAIQISVGLTCVCLTAAVSITPDQLLFVIPYDATSAEPVWSFPYFRTLPEIIYVGLFMVMSATVTAAFGNSRAMMARIAPLSMMSQFFGLYGLAGTATAFIGHGMVTLFTRTFDSQRAGFASTLILLAAGLLLLTWVKEERSPDPL